MFSWIVGAGDWKPFSVNGDQMNEREQRPYVTLMLRAEVESVTRRVQGIRIVAANGESYSTAHSDPRYWAKV